jgi:hypothetical protein
MVLGVDRSIFKTQAKRAHNWLKNARRNACRARQNKTVVHISATVFIFYKFPIDKILYL